MKKYKLLDTDTKMFLGRTLFRIQALTSFGNVEEGDLGGYIEREENLAHEGNAWIYDDACAYDNAQVCDNAQVYDSAWVYGNARVCDNAWVYGDARVYGNVQVYDNALVCDNAQVYDNAQVFHVSWVRGAAQVCGDAYIHDKADILCVSGIGSFYRHTTVCMTEDKKLLVVCGCFFGTLSEFEAKVKKTHGDSKYAREYQLFIELVKLHFNMKEER